MLLMPPLMAPAANLLGSQAPTTILHTGDVRWQAGMAQHAALTGRQVDVLMLDTTYSQRKWTFPPQEEVVELMVQAMAREAAAGPPGEACSNVVGGRLLAVRGSCCMGA